MGKARLVSKRTREPSQRTKQAGFDNAFKAVGMSNLPQTVSQTEASPVAEASACMGFTAPHALAIGLAHLFKHRAVRYVATSSSRTVGPRYTYVDVSLAFEMNVLQRAGKGPSTASPPRPVEALAARGTKRSVTKKVGLL